MKTAMTLPTPSIQYFLLSPTLIVFGIAVVGVLAEAFLPRRARYSGQVTLALGGLIAAFVAVMTAQSDSIPKPRGPFTEQQFSSGLPARA